MRISRTHSILNVQEFNDIVKFPFGGLGHDNRPSNLTGNPQTNDDELGRTQTSIFAVNSDVSFLYMIGKMCQESGHNL